jgi:hypothetical protein
MENIHSARGMASRVLAQFLGRTRDTLAPLAAEFHLFYSALASSQQEGCTIADSASTHEDKRSVKCMLA